MPIQKITWNDVNIGKFMKLEYIKSIEVTTVEKYIEMVGLLYDIDDPKELTMEEYGQYLEAMSGITQLPPMATNLKPETEVKGKKFNRLIDVNKMTGGQFIDFSVIRKNNNLHEMLAVLYRSDDMSFRERADWIKEHETVANAYPYLSFFMNSTLRLLTPIQAFSPTQVKKKMKPLVHRS